MSHRAAVVCTAAARLEPAHSAATTDRGVTRDVTPLGRRGEPCEPRGICGPAPVMGGSSRPVSVNRRRRGAGRPARGEGARPSREIATHIGLESPVSRCEVSGDAWTGAPVGQGLDRERLLVRDRVPVGPHRSRSSVSPCLRGRSGRGPAPARRGAQGIDVPAVAARPALQRATVSFMVFPAPVTRPGARPCRRPRRQRRRRVERGEPTRVPALVREGVRTRCPAVSSPAPREFRAPGRPKLGRQQRFVSPRPRSVRNPRPEPRGPMRASPSAATETGIRPPVAPAGLPRSRSRRRASARTRRRVLLHPASLFRRPPASAPTGPAPPRRARHRSFRLNDQAYAHRCHPRGRNPRGGIGR